MQNPKSRPGSLELPLKKSSVPSPKTARRVKPNGTESDPKLKTTPKPQTPKVATNLRSPRTPLNEIQKKRTGKIPELESQISQLQEELKNTKEELKNSEALKKEAQEEAQEMKHQLIEINISEDSRIEELRKLSLERDKTWESELEAMQRQHEMDSVALSSAINEVQKLKSKLFESEGELEQTKSKVRSLETPVRDSSSMEVENLKQEINLAKNEISQLKSTIVVAETRYAQREAELTEELKKTKAEIKGLRKDDDLKKLESDLTEVKASLMEKEMELQSLRSEMEKKVELGNTEAMEVELKRVKVQCEQWRKAAETAASILNSDEVKTDSIEHSKMLKKFGVLLKKNNM